MRSRQLETAIAVFARETAARLQADLDAGAEIPFELGSRTARARGPQLYCYQPQTAEFIRERWASLRGLPSHTTAVALLDGFDGLERYLLAREAPLGARGRRPRRSHGGPRAEAALRAVIEDVFAEQSAFEVREERLRTALERLDSAARTSPEEVTMLASLHGLAISSPELALAPGLTIAQPDALRGAPEQALAPALDEEHAEEAGRLLVAFTSEDTDVLAALARAREVFGELLRALRLFGDGRITLGRIAWVRLGAGGWSPRALGSGGRPHGMLVVSAAQEDELRAFCNLISRRAPQEGALAWALARFEMGCERASEYEALSDYLLALRALLEPEGPSGEGPAGGGLAGEGTPGVLLAERLAALCALPAERPELMRRVAQALTLERAVLAGAAAEHAGGEALVRQLAEHLRALLRDVICGHLEPDLVALAEELIEREESARALEDSLEGEGSAAETHVDPHAGEGSAAGTHVDPYGGDGSPEEMRGDPLETGEIVDVLI
jgi:hypothetical protein